LVAGVAVVATTQVAQANMGLEVLWAPTVADLQANDASVVVVDSPAQISGSSGSDAITFAGTGLAAGWSGTMSILWNQSGPTYLDVQNLDISSSGGGVLALTAEANNMTRVGSLGLGLTVVNNTFTGAQYGFFYVPNNTILGGVPTDLLTTGSLAGAPPGYAINSSGTVPAGSAPYTIGVGLTLTGSGSISEDQAVVPEPTTVVAAALLLLPFGASTLRLVRRKSA